jgi:G3E family GTPase
MKPLPTIIISGFLGAGKTTLLNRLLAHGLAGKRAGVIVNDFGRLNVDGRLVRDGEHPLLELSNGCVCCTLQPGLARAVQALVARGGLDLLLVEASGISVTSALLHALDSPELAESVRVGTVIAVVDARRYARVLHALPVIRDQVVHANLIVLNHCDEVDAATVDAARDRLRQENPAAPVIATEHGNVAFEDLLSESPRAAATAHGAGHAQPWHAYEVVLPDGADADRIRALADQLPAAVERVKGFVARGGERLVLQKAGPFPASLERCAEGARGGAGNTLVVVASRNVEAELARVFTGCAIRGDGA